MRMLAHIARKYDKGYGHFTTRQNIQFNWPKLVDVPDILADLATVEMHAIQTSGNCIRNVTADHFAGAAADEIEDPRPIAEIIRQWSSLHPEFSFLPRKFKIAVGGPAHDRAALKFHDMAVEIVKNEAGETGYRVLVGGGMGRTPYIGYVVGEFVAKPDILAFLESVMRVYNESGPARQSLQGAHQDPGQRARPRGDAPPGDGRVRGDQEERHASGAAGRTRPHRRLFRAAAVRDAVRRDAGGRCRFPELGEDQCRKHRAPGYAIATISLKPIGGVPGDASAEQMDALADLMDRFGIGEIRVSHEQNLVLPHVKKRDLPAILRG